MKMKAVCLNVCRVKAMTSQEGGVLCPFLGEDISFGDGRLKASHRLGRGKGSPCPFYRNDDCPFKAQTRLIALSLPDIDVNLIWSHDRGVSSEEICVLNRRNSES